MPRIVLPHSPLGLGGSAGKRGTTIAHSSSLITGLLRRAIYHTKIGCRWAQ